MSDFNAVPEFDAPRDASETTSSAIFSRVAVARQQIADIEQKIASLTASIAYWKDEARRFVEDELPEIKNPDERIDTASELYWLHQDIISAAAVAPAFGCKAAQVHAFVRPLEFPAICRGCGAQTTLVIKSRADVAGCWKDSIAQHYISGEPIPLNICDDCHAQNNHQWQASQDAARAEVTRLRAMPYQEYLKTEHWQELRRRMLKRASYRCQVCNQGSVTLQVHHRTYERRGNEEFSDLIVLCSTCHQTFHDNGRLVR